MEEEIDTEKLSEEEEEEVRVITDEIEKIIDEEEKKEVYIPPNINLEDIEEADLFDNQED